VTLRILRAFVWLRWRILLNSLERRGSRDVVERFSLAVEQLSPVVMMLVMVPSALALSGLSAYAGWALVQDMPGRTSLQFVRFILFGGCVVAAVGPIVFPARDRTNAVRLLLLPIPRFVLFAGQVFSALADPWMLLMIAVLAAVPAGMLTGGAPAAAAAAATGGLLLMSVLVGLSVLMSNAVHLIVRDRRRGEIAALVLILVLPVLGMLPTVLYGGRQRQPGANASEPGTSRRAPASWRAFERAALSAAPSESYITGVRAAAESRYAPASARLLANAGTAVVLHAAAFLAFTRVLASPGVSHSRRRRRDTSAPAWRIPGLSSAASAIARNQVRLALRTPRGRSTLLSPIVVFGMFALLLSRPSEEFHLLSLSGGLGLAAFACAVCLLAIVPLAMNQFAVDGAGLTLVFLAPVKTRTMLAGKAIGNGVVASLPAVVCFSGAALLFPAGNPWLWASVPPAFIATYVLASPAAAALSAVFPRAVDLNSIGSGSNAHGAAGLLGVLAFVAASLPCLAVIVIATAFLQRPALAPALLLVWLVISAAASRLLFTAVGALVDRRRENLALTIR
jgi:hypothetical protein